MTRCARYQGFTLLELLIAISIFTVVSMLAFGGLRSVQTTASGVREAGERLAELQTALLVMGRDIEQSMNRTIRDNFGQEQPAFMGGQGKIGAFMELSRNGWRNPAGFGRSHVQRIGYALDDNQLIRLAWPVLDRSYGTEPQPRVLVKGVKSVVVRYLDQDRQWLEQWPKLQVDDQPGPPLPIAVEVTLDIEGWGFVQRLYRVAGEAPLQINTVTNGGGAGGDGPLKTKSKDRASGGSDGGNTGDDPGNQEDPPQ